MKEKRVREVIMEILLIGIMRCESEDFLEISSKVAKFGGYWDWFWKEM